GGLISELAAFVSRPGDTFTWAQVDEAMWHANPRTSGSHRDAIYRNPASQGFIGGTVTRTLVSPNHAGMAQWIQSFILTAYGSARLAEEAADPALPAIPITRGATRWNRAGRVRSSPVSSRNCRCPRAW